MSHKTGSNLRRLLFIGVAVITLCAGLGQASASVDYFDLEPEQLVSTKILSVSKRPETVAEAAAAVYVITSEDISRSGVTNIPDALRMAPGVHVAQLDSNSWAIAIRGFNSGLSNKLLVLIDGRTIYNPVFGGVLWEAHDLMLQDIERIEVVRGPGGTLWGANAVNGVINIITKNTRDTQGNLVSVLYGNEEEGTLSARHGGAFDNGGSYRLYGKAFRHDALHSPSGGSAYDEYDGYRAGFRTDWDEVTVQGDAYRTHTDQRRTVFSLTQPAFDADQTVKYEGANILARWTRSGDNGTQLSVQSYIDWSKRSEAFHFIDNRTIYDIETQYNLAPGGVNEIIMGAGFRFASDDNPGSANATFTPQSRSDSLYNAFLQDKITLVPDKWYLTVGSKFEHNEYSGFEIQPSARLQWFPNETQTVWGAVSRAVRTPTPIEEDLTNTIGTVPLFRLAFVPNDSFKSEEVVSYELGYRNQVTPTLSADATTFYNVYDHLQTFTIMDPILVNNGIDPLHVFVPVQFRNDMKGESYGFELATNWQVNPDLKLSANYTFLHLWVSALDPTQEGAEDLYPSHQFSLRGSWNITDSWMLDATIHYVDQLQATAIDDSLRVDLNLGWQINQNVRFNLVGQNIANNGNREFGAAGDLNAAETETSVFGKITWEF